MPKPTAEDQLADTHRAELATLPHEDAEQIEVAMAILIPVVMSMRHTNAERLLRMLTELETLVSR